MSATTDNTPYELKSSDYFRILIAKNPAPSNNYIKNYGELCKAEGEHHSYPTAQTLNKLERQREWCKIDIAHASVFSYEKRKVEEK